MGFTEALQELAMSPEEVWRSIHGRKDPQIWGTTGRPLCDWNEWTRRRPRRERKETGWVGRNGDSGWPLWSLDFNLPLISFHKLLCLVKTQSWFVWWCIYLLVYLISLSPSFISMEGHNTVPGIMIVSKYVTVSKSRCNPYPQGVCDLVRKTDINLIIIEVLWECGTGRVWLSPDRKHCPAEQQFSGKPQRSR